ncbi:MerR family transcriptional regulator [Bradyrhizobium elkanii]
MKTEPEAFRWLWPLFEADKPQYSAADVVKLTDVAEHTLQNWSNRGLIKFKSTKAGKGGTRLYTKATVFTIKFAQSLIDLGLETTIALYVGTRISQQLNGGAAEIIARIGRRHAMINFIYGANALISKRTGASELAYSVQLTGPGMPDPVPPAPGEARSLAMVPIGALITEVQKKFMPTPADWREWTIAAEEPA